MANDLQTDLKTDISCHLYRRANGCPVRNSKNDTSNVLQITQVLTTFIMFGMKKKRTSQSIQLILRAKKTPAIFISLLTFFMIKPWPNGLASRSMFSLWPGFSCDALRLLWSRSNSNASRRKAFRPLPTQPKSTQVGWPLFVVQYNTIQYNTIVYCIVLYLCYSKLID